MAVAMDCRAVMNCRALVFTLLFTALSACGGGSHEPTPTPQTDPLQENADITSPVRVFAQPGNAKNILYWQPVANAERYNLYWTSSGFVDKQTAHRIENVSHGYVHAELSNGETFTYAITAVIQNEESVLSTSVSSIPRAVKIDALFADVNLQHCVNAYTSSNNWIYADEMRGHLDCAYRGIRSLEGIEYLITLDSLNLSNNAITDFTPLLHLYQLQSMDLRANALAQQVFEEDDTELLPLFLVLNKLWLSDNAHLDCAQLVLMQSLLQAERVDIATAQPGVNCLQYTTDTGGPPHTEPGDAGAGIKPQHLSALHGDRQITLTWDSISDASSYTLYWLTSPGVTIPSGQRIADVQPGYVHTGLQNSTAYYYIVTATVKGEESEPAEEVSATPRKSGVALTGLFADAALQACIDALAATKAWIFAHELVGSVDCASRGINSLAGVEHLTSISGLNLLNNAVSDISPLANLTQLRQLYLNNNQISDTSPLASLTALQLLNLRNNQIGNISALLSLQQIQQLYLDNNLIVDVSGLSALAALNILDLRHNLIGGENIGHIDQLVALTQASSIRLAGNSGLSCLELKTLVDALPAAVVDLAATLDAVNCALPPQDPQNIKTIAGHQRVIITWDSVPRAERYHIYWSNNAGTPISNANPLNAVISPYSHQGLTNGVNYYYVVTAENAAGASAPSIEVSATPAQIALTGLFADIKLQTCVDTLAAFHGWTTADQISGSVNCSALGISSIAGIEHLSNITSLSLNKNKLTDLSPLSSLSGLRSLSLYENQISQAAPLNQLTQLTDLFLSDNVIYDAAPLASLTQLVNLDISANAFGKQGLGHVDHLVVLQQAAHIKLNNNPTMSCYELDALRNALGIDAVTPTESQVGVNCSASSSVPTRVRAVAGDTQITISWDEVAGATQYKIYWSTTADISTALSDYITSSKASVLHQGLTNDTTYYYIVTAMRGSGESGASAAISTSPSADGVSLQGLFPDTNLRGCVNSVASANNWKLAHEVTGAINCSAREVSDLSGLEYLSALQSLRLGSNNIVDVSPLSGLSSVTFLDLFNNDISDISGLVGLSALKTLYLHANQITDISALSSLESLSYLILDDNAITDISPLANVSSLTQLLARKNQISDVGALASNTQLIQLYMSENNIINLAPLANLLLLKQLDMSKNKVGGLGVGNVDQLATLSNLSFLGVSGNLQMSCTELDTLVTALGPSIVSVGVPVEGVNCTMP